MNIIAVKFLKRIPDPGNPGRITAYHDHFVAGPELLISLEDGLIHLRIPGVDRVVLSPLTNVEWLVSQPVEVPVKSTRKVVKSV